MTKRLFTILAGVALLVALAPAVGLADSISGSGGWQTWAASDLNNNGIPYWDNTSSDGSAKNIGYCISGTGNCTMTGGDPGVLPYWGNTNGSAVSSITFLSGGTGNGAALTIEIANNAGSNIFGYTDSTGSYVIFNGSATAGATATFTPVGTYSFFLDDTAVGDTWYTDSSLNSQGTGQQHFAVFNGGTGTYWLGMEDLPFTGTGAGDKDYNDMVVKITSNPVPEPGTLTLLGTGLIGLARMIRRRRAA